MASIIIIITINWLQRGEGGALVQAADEKDTRLRFNKQEGRQAWVGKLEVRFVWFWGAGARPKVVHVQQGIDKVHSTVRSSAVHPIWAVLRSPCSVLLDR